MKLSDLDYPFPESLVATSPCYPPRVMLVNQGLPQEIPFQEISSFMQPGDTLVLNDTKVLKRRVFAGEYEILFLKQLSPFEWEVLFPARHLNLQSQIALPEGLSMTLIKKGLPQIVRLSKEISESYFESHGDLPLPPYIQKLRDNRKNSADDRKWYQTQWAQNPGSFAAPTASLHFRESDIENFQNRGVHISKLTLHVGLGTFLPIKTEDLSCHEMHAEYVHIPSETIRNIHASKNSGRRVWAFGTTSARAIESYARGLLQQSPEGHFNGDTELFLKPGDAFKLVDVLLTNFHQPKSTLMALVATHSGLENVHRSYQWAIEHKFRLFSYGDLSIWMN